MQTSDNFDIAIIGGGMVGASLACLLAQANREWRIALIEAFPLAAATTGKPTHYQPSFDARSSAIARGSVEIFQRLELWSQLERHATPIRQVHVSDRGHPGGSLIDAAEHGLDAVGYVIENAWLGAVLLARVRDLSNLTCLAPARTTQLQPRREGVSLQLEQEGVERQVFTRLAAVADGGDSPLRQALGIDVDIVDYRQTAIIANVAFSHPHRNIAFERFTEQGPMALLPLESADAEHRSALVWTRPSENVNDTLALSDTHFLAALQDQFGHRLGHFTRVGARHAYPLQLKIAREQVRSNIAIMGNAAHFLHPVAGQGFNLALRDCATLSEVLNGGHLQGLSPGKISLLQQYQRLQALDQAATIQFSDRITQLFSTRAPGARTLRNLGLLGLELLPPAKELLAQHSMGKALRQARI